MRRATINLQRANYDSRGFGVVCASVGLCNADCNTTHCHNHRSDTRLQSLSNSQHTGHSMGSRRWASLPKTKAIGQYSGTYRLSETSQVSWQTLWEGRRWEWCPSHARWTFGSASLGSSLYCFSMARFHLERQCSQSYSGIWFSGVELPTYSPQGSICNEGEPRARMSESKQTRRSTMYNHISPWSWKCRHIMKCHLWKTFREDPTETPLRH